MEYPESASNIQYNHSSIRERLINGLERLREQSPQSFSKPVYVLPAINDNVEDQIEQQLLQESKDSIGRHIILIPYLLKNSH